MKKKYRPEEEKKQLLKRLNIIEGQIEGIKKMVESDRYCNDILIQIAAVRKSLQTLGTSMLKQHMKTCVVDGIKSEKMEVIEEVIKMIERFQ